MELIEQNKYFDIKYFVYNTTIDFNELITFSVQNKYLEEGYAELIINSYKDAIYNQIMKTYDFDLEDDYNLKLRELSTRYYLALNDYLRSLESPFNALETLLKNSPEVLVSNSFDRFNYYDAKVNKKLVTLKEKSSLVIEYNFEYKQFIKTISNYLGLLGNDKELLYPTMDNNGLKNITSLEMLCNVIDDYILETDILNKFNQGELLVLLKKIMHSEDYKGISSVAMYNYIFNYFFKDSTSIIITESMQQIIVESIINNLISSNDVINIIKNGGIKYSNEEQKYIIDNFVPAFQNEIIDKKNYLPFIKIK